MNRTFAYSFLAVLALSTLYRIVPYEMRPEWLGAPQLAIAVFAGSVFVHNKKLAFAFPLASMLASDVIMQLLHWANPSYMAGFYQGQLSNYLLILGTTVLGFFVRPGQLLSVIGGLVAAPVVYWLLSNLMVWMGNGGLKRPLTPAGLLQCYADALPFLRNSLSGTLVAGALFFGAYRLLAAPRHPAVA